MFAGRWLWCSVILSLLMPPKVSQAIDLFYDFEGGSGSTVADRLTVDGSQDGTLFNNVAFTTIAPFGSGAVEFDIPDPIDLDPVPPFSTIEVPGTTFGNDFDLTVAMHVNNNESPPDFTRLFTSFQGTGPPPPDRLILDMDPSGGAIPGLRAIVNGVSLTTPEVPDGMQDPGYHHYAMTIEDGFVTIYFDGEDVIDGDVGGGYSNTASNIHIGEDPHDAGGTANEQLIANIDEVLVINRALSAGDIRLLADGNPVPAVVTPEGATERAVYYNFEGDAGTTITDKFNADGSQNAIVHRMVEVDATPAHAKLGGQSGRLDHPHSEAERERPFSQIEVGPVGNLGDQFTLSAVVNVPEGGGYSAGGLTRLFSSFRGTGGVGPEELIVDFDPNATVADIGLRFVWGSTQVRSDVTFSVDEDHTLTAVYDDGEILLYLDGEEVGAGVSDVGGPVDLGDRPLMIGEDNDTRIPPVVNENFIGIMDDVLILSRALSPAEVAELASQGAGVFLDLGGTRGDFDGNGQLDLNDINLLVAASASGDNDPRFDLDGDTTVGEDDLGVWVRDLFGTWIGDANLDFEFNSDDLIETFSRGKYDTDEVADWSDGDWTGDQRYNSDDLLAAFADGGFDQGPFPGAAAVPEPATGSLLGFALLLGCRALRRSHAVGLKTRNL